MSYSDIKSIPTYQRRFFLGLLTKNTVEKAEYQEKLKEQSKGSSSGGKRTTTISGEALKSRLVNGEVPTK